MKNYDAILDMWAAGVSRKEMCIKLGYRSEGSLHYVLNMAREINDPRAMKRRYLKTYIDRRQRLGNKHPVGLDYLMRVLREYRVVTGKNSGIVEERSIR